MSHRKQLTISLFLFIFLAVMCLAIGDPALDPALLVDEAETVRMVEWATTSLER